MGFDCIISWSLAVFLYARLKNVRFMLYRPSVNFSFPDNSSYSLHPIELKLGK